MIAQSFQKPVINKLPYIISSNIYVQIFRSVQPDPRHDSTIDTDIKVHIDNLLPARLTDLRPVKHLST